MYERLLAQITGVRFCMTEPGNPKRDAAGAACRNAAAAIDEWYAKVQEAIASLPKEEWVWAVRALYHMDEAIAQLDAAADEYYREEETS